MGQDVFFPIAAEFMEYLLSAPVWETWHMTYLWQQNVNHSRILIQPVCLFFTVVITFVLFIPELF